ncbi:hypothetical protein KU43_00760 [Mesotoga sp. SC_NapDC2]|nr:hypothetical protein RM69_00545 [Mesotoga sp. SC_NapDC3]PXF34653.1 hypothetical protein EU77_06250 [Mesotoga sp. SC_NapDC]RIZ61750.1 hypothetical protein KU43_00760 [Mesotoga sp. SC_NapDC2]
MLYRILFSLVPLFLMPFLNYQFLDSVIAVLVILPGMILGNKTDRVARIQNLTMILFYVVLIFGYFHDTTGTIYRTEVMILVAAQGVSGFYGLLHQKRRLAVVFSLGYWILVGVAMGRIAYFRLGNSGIVLTVVLMLLVAAQDVRRIFKPLAKNPFMQGGEDSNE